MYLLCESSNESPNIVLYTFLHTRYSIKSKGKNFKSFAAIELSCLFDEYNFFMSEAFFCRSYVTIDE